MKFLHLPLKNKLTVGFTPRLCWSEDISSTHLADLGPVIVSTYGSLCIDSNQSHWDARSSISSFSCRTVGPTRSAPASTWDAGRASLVIGENQNDEARRKRCGENGGSGDSVDPKEKRYAPDVCVWWGKRRRARESVRRTGAKDGGAEAGNQRGQLQTSSFLDVKRKKFLLLPLKPLVLAWKNTIYFFMDFILKIWAHFEHFQFICGFGFYWNSLK